MSLLPPPQAPIQLELALSEKLGGGHPIWMGEVLTFHCAPDNLPHCVKYFTNTHIFSIAFLCIEIAYSWRSSPALFLLLVVLYVSLRVFVGDVVRVFFCFVARPRALFWAVTLTVGHHFRFVFPSWAYILKPRGPTRFASQRRTFARLGAARPATRWPNRSPT